MRKSMKKLIALTLACLMLATLFVGCGKKDDGDSSGGTDAVSERHHRRGKLV